MYENKFLITYGLHSFVRHDQFDNKSVFSIRGSESQKMIGHAASLISGHFGDVVDIQIT